MYSRQANCHPGTDTSVLYELGSCESSPGTDSWVHGPHQVSWLSKLGYWWCYQSPREASCSQWRTCLSDSDTPPFILLYPSLHPRSTPWVCMAYITSFQIAPFQLLLLPPLQTWLILHDCLVQAHFTCMQPNSLAWLLGFSRIWPHHDLFFIIFISKCLSPVFGLGDTAHLMLLSHWRCSACSLLAIPTSAHLQNGAPALPDSTTPNSCFHTGKLPPIVFSCCPKCGSHLYPHAPGGSEWNLSGWGTGLLLSTVQWCLPGAPWHLAAVLARRNNADSHCLPGPLHFFPLLNSLNSQIFHRATFDLWSNS